MARDYTNDSRATFAGGRNGMILGAVAGALLFAIAALILDTMNVGSGGPGLGVMAGAAAGGLAGMMIGALRARQSGYPGPERRLLFVPYEGRERRHTHY